MSATIILPALLFLMVLLGFFVHAKVKSKEALVILFRSRKFWIRAITIVFAMMVFIFLAPILFVLLMWFYLKVTEDTRLISYLPDVLKDSRVIMKDADGACGVIVFEMTDVAAVQIKVGGLGSSWIKPPQARDVGHNWALGYGHFCGWDVQKKYGLLIEKTQHKAGSYYYRYDSNETWVLPDDRLIVYSFVD